MTNANLPSREDAWKLVCEYTQSESLRKMLAYADSVKQQKADEFLAKLRVKNGSKPSEEVP